MRGFLRKHEVRTVVEMQWPDQLDNGELLRMTEEAGFDVIITLRSKHPSPAKAGWPKIRGRHRLQSLASRTAAQHGNNGPSRWSKTGRARLHRNAAPAETAKAWQLRERYNIRGYVQSRGEGSARPPHDEFFPQTTSLLGLGVTLRIRKHKRPTSCSGANRMTCGEESRRTAYENRMPSNLRKMDQGMRLSPILTPTKNRSLSSLWQ